MSISAKELEEMFAKWQAEIRAKAGATHAAAEPVADSLLAKVAASRYSWLIVLASHAACAAVGFWAGR